jgi:uncharacterized protein YdeI (YjbR/CyaY-like superfamily)
MSSAAKAVSNLDPRVDAYVARAAPFAQPILNHLRQLLHKGCPGVQESIKWSRPFFEYQGAIIGNMSAFKEHCTFGFWGSEIGAVLRESSALREEGMGSFGRLTSLKDLPSDKQMLDWIRQAAAFVDSGNYTSPVTAARRRVAKAPKPELVAPEEFTAALQKHPKAAGQFATLSPSCRREYLEWIVDAKRAETRASRIATAIEWISEGKQRNWKYQS